MLRESLRGKRTEEREKATQSRRDGLRERALDRKGEWACFLVGEETKQKCLCVMNSPSAKTEDRIPEGLIKQVEPDSVSLSSWLSYFLLPLSVSSVNEYNIAAML